MDGGRRHCDDGGHAPSGQLELTLLLLFLILLISRKLPLTSTKLRAVEAENKELQMQAVVARSKEEMQATVAQYYHRLALLAWMVVAAIAVMVGFILSM